MILSTILKPPPAAPDAVESERRQWLPTRSADRARQHQRAVAIGTIVSVLFHVLLIVLSPLIIRYLEPGRVAFLPLPRRLGDQGTEIVNIRVTEIARVQPAPEPEAIEPEPEPDIPTHGEPVGEPEPTLTAAEALRPRVGDWRLWVVLPLTLREPTPAERAATLRDRLAQLIEEYEDSAAALAALEAERNDWTVGEEGNKWGVSPGKLHLGPITLPFPFYLGPTREEAARQADWAEIQRQAGQVGADEEFKERVKAIRERKEREKKAQEEAKRDSTSS